MPNNNSDVTLRLKGEDVSLSKVFKVANSAATKVTGSLVGMEKQLADVNAILTKTNAAKKVVDNYLRQKQAVELTASKLKSYRAELARSAHAVSAVGVPTERMAARHARLAQVTDRTEKQISRQAATLKRSQRALKDMGVSSKQAADVSGRLTAAQAKLESQAAATSAAIKKVRGAIGGLSGSGGSGALSYAQRLRGEFLSLTASAVGLFGVLEGGRQAFDVGLRSQAVSTRAGAAFDGDAARAQQELRFIRQLADDIQVQYDHLSESYSKFLNASKGSLTNNEQRQVFTDIATAARVARLSADDFNGVMRALEQIASKGTVQMEELKGQIGDRLPGAVQIMADALGKGTGEVLRIIEAGELGSESLTVFAAELKSRYQSELPESLKSSSAAMADFNTAVFEARNEFNEGGFTEAITQALRDLTAELRTNEAKSLMQSLGASVGVLVKGFVVLVKNGDLLVAVFVALASRSLGLTLAGFFGRVQSDLARTGTEATRTAVAVGALRRAFSLLGGLPGVLFTVVGALSTLAFSAGGGPEGAAKSIEELNVELLQLRGNLEGVAQARRDQRLEQIKSEVKAAEKELLVLQRLSVPFTIKGNATAAPIGLPVRRHTGEKERAQIPEVNKRLQLLRDLQAELEKPVQKVDFEGGSASKFDLEADRFARKVEDRYLKATARIARLSDEAEKQAIQEARSAEEVRERVSAQYEQLLVDLDKVNEARRARAKELGKDAELLDPAKIIQAREAEVDAALANFESKRAKAQQRLADQLHRYEVQLGESQADTLEDRLDLVRAHYAKLIDDLKALGASDNQLQSIRQLRFLELNQAEKDFGVDQIAHIEEEINRLLAERQVRLNEINIQQESGLITAAQAREQILSDNETLLPLLQSQREQAEAVVTALGDPSLAAGVIHTIQGVEQSVAGLKRVRKEVLSLEQVNQNFATGMTNAFDGFIGGAKSAGEAFGDFARSFLRQIANMILQQTILNALQNSSPFGGAVAAINAPVAHSGGVVGSDVLRQRSLPAATFAFAPKYHTGGIAGFAPDEVPAVLRRGEEVVTENDIRHRKNGGLQSQSPLNVKVVNTIDAGEFTNEGLNDSGTDSAFLNKISSLRSEINAELGG